MRHAPRGPCFPDQTLVLVGDAEREHGRMRAIQHSAQEGQPSRRGRPAYEGANTGLATRTSAPRTSASATSSASWTFVPTHANRRDGLRAQQRQRQVHGGATEAARRLHVRVRDEGDATARADGGHLRCEELVGGIVRGPSRAG
ncbi:MAG: hypothetical protein ACLSVD_07420 [Eggerthellaceae bacterium]